MTKKNVDNFLIGLMLAICSFLGTSIIKTFINENKIYAVKERVDRIEYKIDTIYNYIIQKEGE